MNLSDGTQITQDDLGTMVSDHLKWLNDDPGGKRLALIEANLGGASLGGANLEGANLKWANLEGANLKWASLGGANLEGANLGGASLGGASLEWASLEWANLEGASLEGANLPNSPKVKNLFTVVDEIIKSGKGSLDMEKWHDEDCKTTHCVAGFAVYLAGDAGYELEEKYGASVAGALIINSSCEYLNGIVPNFTASNKEGLIFIEDCAEKEKERN